MSVSQNTSTSKRDRLVTGTPTVSPETKRPRPEDVIDLSSGDEDNTDQLLDASEESAPPKQGKLTNKYTFVIQCTYMDGGPPPPQMGQSAQELV